MIIEYWIVSTHAVKIWDYLNEDRSDYLFTKWFHCFKNKMYTWNDIITITIIIIISRYQHGYPWPSLATPPYLPLLPTGPQGYILWRGSQENITYELVPTSPAVSRINNTNISIYIYIYSVKMCKRLNETLIGWGGGCKIHWLHLSRGVRPPPNECPGYDTKQSDGEIPAVLELWGMRSTPSLPSLPGPLCPGVVAPDRDLSRG